MTTGRALLLTMIEPPPGPIYGFSAWRDAEDMLGGDVIVGIHSALRFVCREGWPRFLAVYDLEDIAVLDAPLRKAVLGNHLSPWLQRLLFAISGYWCFSGTQINEGTSITGGKGFVASLLVIRWRRGKPEWQDLIVRGLRSNFEGRTGTLQVRAFMAGDTGTRDYVGLVECTLPHDRKSLDFAAFGNSAKGIDLINVYSPRRSM